MSFQRLSERVQGKSRPPESRWKVISQSRTSGRETPITEYVVFVAQAASACHWNWTEWATANVRHKATVVCEVRGSQSDKRLGYGCEQLAQSRYAVAPWPGVELLERANVTC